MQGRHALGMPIRLCQAGIDQQAMPHKAKLHLLALTFPVEQGLRVSRQGGEYQEFRVWAAAFILSGHSLYETFTEDNGHLRFCEAQFVRSSPRPRCQPRQTDE